MNMGITIWSKFFLCPNAVFRTLIENLSFVIEDSFNIRRK